ncbi:aldehyde dehydrogenase [Agromyces rhizosphaerae]|uniref:Aldehyde dehydrogenase n=1 Tax=Agromyces rhizosphaerae TaxID=88374 RepID=A0A9W6D0D9_9MICO|nr:aldehyde dehydrogenase family protein [Agromyces rhizosphaerae]GLI28584.1 aldehyde dehydrogenase [Agromyces rhizosphaerae]
MTTELMSQPTGASSAIADRVARVRAGFASGITRPLEWRRRQLDAVERMLREHHDELEQAIFADLGKPPVEGYMTELGPVLTEIGIMRKHLAKWTRRRKVPFIPFLWSKGFIQREPLGTVLIIAPWNYPVDLLFMPAVGAIAAGDAVVLKPSELAPATSAVLAELVPRYLDPRAIAVVEGGVPETTELLAMKWDHVFYTGNGVVGRIVMEAASKHLTPVTLELGGKSPVWVDPSANLEDTANWLTWGKFLNTGQTCVAPDYVMTTPEVQPRLIAALTAEIERFYGADPRRSPDYGRIVNRRHTDRLAGLIAGADVALGGEVEPEERYVAPTILRDVAATDPVMQQEIFGPVLPIVPVAGVDEAIEQVNAGDKPLAMYVFSEADAPVEAFLERTSSGSVAINASMIQLGVDSLPFGGVGASGMGSYHGEKTIEIFSHNRSVLRKAKGPNFVKLTEPPYTPKVVKRLRSV